MTAKSSCENCGSDITMSGSEMCPICDPDVDVIIEGGVKQKSPYLCHKCFKKHMEEHRARRETS